MVKLERDIVSGDQVVISRERGGCTVAFCDSRHLLNWRSALMESDSKLWLNIANVDARQLILLMSLTIGKEFRIKRSFLNLTCFEVR